MSQPRPIRCLVLVALVLAGCAGSDPDVASTTQAEAAIIPCRMKLDYPHNSHHQPGTINVTGQVQCDERVNALAITIQLWHNSVPMGPPKTSKVLDGSIAKTNAAYDGCLDGLWVATASSVGVAPNGYTPVIGLGSIQGQWVEIDCNAPKNAPPKCVDRCEAVHGFIDDNGRCIASCLTPFTNTFEDVTDAVCGTGAAVDAGCEPYPPDVMCAAVGGFCTNDGSYACVDAFDNQVLYPNQPPTTVWDPADWIGSCRSDVPFNSPTFEPSCGSPGGGTGGGGPSCQSPGTQCESDGDCCNGSCVDPTTGSPLFGGDGSSGVCGGGDTQF